MTQLLLDHIVILVPYESLINLPPSLTKNFFITPGGRHGDNLTQNKLITFKDGSYIELIAFIHDDPKHKEGHWWGKKPFGIIDFAFTTSGDDADALHSEISERLEKADLKDEKGEVFRYGPPKAGSRKREDGMLLKWKVMFNNAVRGEVPFFCHDLTDRSLRVPGADENTNHPSEAYGVRSLTVMVSPDRWGEMIAKYAAILGIQPVTTDEGAMFQLHSVKPYDSDSVGPILFLQAPVTDRQKEIVKEGGSMITNLTFLSIVDLDLDFSNLV